MNRLPLAALTLAALVAPLQHAEASAYTSTTGRGRYVVTSSGGLNVRSLPSRYGARRGRLANGREIYVYGISGDWARFYYNGKRSFVHKGYLRRKTTSAPRPTTPTVPTAATPSVHPARTSTAGRGTYRVSANSLNVRTGPGTSYSTVGRLARDARITVFGIGGTWARFRFNGASRYVHKGYLSRVASAPAPSSPAPTPPSPTSSADASARTSTTGRGTYEVISATLNVRSAPASSASRVGRLGKGRRITVFGIGGNWARFPYNGASRYVHKAYLRRVSTRTQPHPAYTTRAGRGTHLVSASGGLTVRSGPGASFSRVGRVTGSVFVHGKSQGWARITYANRTRFVASSYLRSAASLPGVTHSLRYEVTSVAASLRSAPSATSISRGRLNRGATFTASRKSGSYVGFSRGGGLVWAFTGTVKPIPTRSGNAVARVHYQAKARTTLLVSPGGASTGLRPGTNSHLYSLREARSGGATWVLVEYLRRPAGWIRKSALEQTIDTSAPVVVRRQSRSNTWSRGNDDFAVGVDGSTTISHSRRRGTATGSMRAFVKVFGRKVTIARLNSTAAGDFEGTIRRLDLDGIRIYSLGTGDSPFSHGYSLSVSYSIAENVFGVKPEFRVPVLGIPVKVAFDASVGLSLSSSSQKRGGGWDTSSSLSLSAGIGGEIGVDVVVAGAGVGGELSVSTGPSLDFSLRPNEGTSADLGVGASVDGRIYLYAKIGVGFLSYTRDVTLLNYTLASTRATLTEASVLGN